MEFLPRAFLAGASVLWDQAPRFLTQAGEGCRSQWCLVGQQVPVCSQAGSWFTFALSSGPQTRKEPGDEGTSIGDLLMPS